MKKTILAVALGIVVSVAPAHGQGSIFFNNYGTTTDAKPFTVYFCVPEPSTIAFISLGLVFAADLPSPKIMKKAISHSRTKDIGFRSGGG